MTEMSVTSGAHLAPSDHTTGLLARLRDEGPLWAGYAITATAAWMALERVGHQGIREAMAAAPAHPAFWLALLASYLLTPAGEWIIYHRLWNLPAGGLWPLLRKQMSNELVMGYSGEAQFYLWAREHTKLETSPFGAVKDVAILSALAGNLATLLLMALNWHLLVRVAGTTLGTAFTTSVVVIVLTSLLLFAFRRKLFSLSRQDIAFVMATHGVRIMLAMLLVGWLWHFVLPSADLSLLIMLATLRMMLSRLPLLPAKDIVFAGLVATLAGQDIGLVAAVALVGSLVVAGHVVVALAGAATDLSAKVRQ